MNEKLSCSKNNTLMLLAEVLFVSCLASIIFVIMYNGKLPFANFDRAPVVSTSIYSQDLYDVLVAIKNASESKSVYENESRGWPYPGNYLKYPNADFFNYLIVYAMSGIWLKNIYAVLNAFIWFGYLVTVLSAYIVIKFLGADKFTSVVASLLYAFMPYHLLRLEWGHVHLAYYWIAPLVIYYYYQIYEGNHAKSLKIPILMGIAISFSGIYYVFFSYIILAFAAFISKNKIRSLLIVGFAFLISIAFILIAYFINYTIATAVSPPFIDTNKLAVTRAPFAGINLGLKLISFLLPTYWSIAPTGINIDFLGFKHVIFPRDFSLTPAINETYSEALGFPLLIFIFFSLCILRSKLSNDKALIYGLLFMVLVFSADSLALLVSGSTMGLMRALNRVSVFIIFLLMFAFIRCAVMNDKIKLLSFVSLVSLICFTVDIFNYRDNRYYNHAEINENFNFIDYLNKNTLDGDKLLMLPFVPYPEGGSGLVTYHHNIPLFAENNLYISYGGVDGSSSLILYKEISEAPPRRLLEISHEHGFKYAVIDDRSGASIHHAALINYCTRWVKRTDVYRYIVNLQGCYDDSR